MNTQPLDETRESLGELIRSISRISNVSPYELNQTDKDRLEKAKNILSKHSDTDNSPIIVQSVAPIDKTLSAEEYLNGEFKKRFNADFYDCLLDENHLPDGINTLEKTTHQIMDSYASLRAEQAKEDHDKELKVQYNLGFEHGLNKATFEDGQL